jgi:TolB-like protein
MAEFFAELKRRHIYRVGAAYVVVAWALAQGVDMLSQVFELPGWIARPAVILLAVGFPVALVTAWMIESKPHVAVATTVRSKPTIVDWTLCGALAAVLLFMGYQQLAPSLRETQQAGVDATKEAAVSTATAVSLAVLPFANLSSDPEQEFFSDGITEEITSVLAKVPELRVVARTSAFQFKGENRDIQTIGQQLHATHLIEGSVRRAGERVRITAQLISAADGTHVWTESYDRQLTDIFAIQEDIALAIAGALRVPLGLRPGERLVSYRDIDPEAYQQYLRAISLRRSGQIAEAAALLEQVVMNEPGFAPAWAALAQAYAQTPLFGTAWVNGSLEELRELVNSSLPKAEAAARRAIELDPNVPGAYLALSTFGNRRETIIMREELLITALALDPQNPDALHARALQLAGAGRLKEALAVRQRVQQLEPFVPVFAGAMGLLQWAAGDTDAAIAALTNFPRGNPFRAYFLPRIYASAGRYRDSAEELLATPWTYGPGMREAAVSALLNAPAAVTSPQSLPRLGNMEFVYLHVGAADRVLEFHEGNLDTGYVTNVSQIWLWHSSYAPVRKTERFKRYMRNVGYFDYWRAKGWPDLCRPVGADDFVCD